MLNKTNYFTIENKYISNSRIGDFLKDKHYFYQKHITGEIENKKTTPMLIGSGVDLFLTKGKDAFMKEYICVSRRNLKSPPVGIIELTPVQYDEIISICESVQRHDLYKELSTHTAQQILTMPMNLGFFEGICGCLDWFKVEGNVGIITDLKTAEQASNITKYHYHSIEYRYYSQAAMYSLLLKHNYPEVKEVIFRHLTVEKDSDHVHNVYAFIIDAERIAMEEENILTNILPEIAKEKDFLPKNISWKDARILGAINEDF